MVTPQLDRVEIDALRALVRRQERMLAEQREELARVRAQNNRLLDAAERARETVAS